ncbi:uncharacterized protein LOC122637110 isoform X1 [Vespula pensylvanica]|uniref:uncharacterized protein LOC122637110 isoform X1 n=1 Tax=Vespula pensylvanica TaxID=30213 RepID=UPI001CBA1F9A|nr:uncharacterized protein LOC122637110 isoform X1 [Vespula pensylvanica]
MERKKEKIINNSQVAPASICTSISSINADMQDMNCTSLFLHTSQIENEVVSSSNNLRNMMAKKKNRYTIYKPIITSSSIEQSSRKKDCFNGKTLSIDENLPVMEKYLPLPTNTEQVFDNANFFKLQEESAKYDNFGRPEIVITTSHKEKSNRTFFNWRVMLNENGHLLIKGTLESGKIARTKPILKRLTVTSVESIFKQIYHLKGNIVDNRNELPEYVRGKFFNGFPDDWENVIRIWKLFISQGLNSNFHWPIKIIDSDNDTNSKMSDVTLECRKEDGIKFNESGVISMGQKPNVSNLRIPSSTLRGINGEDRSLETKTDNDVYTPEIYVPGSTNLLLSSMAKKTYNHNSLDRKEQYQNKSVNIHQLPLLQKEHTMRNMQEDTINIIVNNLLHKDCPQEYISKIIQMFDSLNDVYSYGVASNDTNGESRVKCNDKKSGLCSNQIQGNEIINDSGRSCISERSHGKGFEELEDETCPGISKIISERILLQNERVSMKRHKHEQRRESMNYNAITNSHVKLQEKSKKNRPIYHSTSSNDNIENDNMENHDPAHVSVSVHKEKRKRDNIKLLHFGLSDRRKKDSLKNNRYCENSSTEDEMELLELKHKEHLNMAKIIEHSAKKPKIINTFADTNHVNVVHRTRKNSINNNKAMSLKNKKQNGTSTPLAIVDSHTLNMNSNEDMIDEKSEFIPVLNDTKELIKNTHESNLRAGIISDDRLIDEHKNDSKDRRTPRGSEFQIEREISPENAKYATIETDTSLSISNPLKSRVKTCREANTSNDEFLSAKKPQLLSDWIPRVVIDSKSVCELSLVFEGKLLNEAGHVVHRKFTTEHIRKRLSATLIEGINQELYRLIGDLHDSKHGNIYTHFKIRLHLRRYVKIYIMLVVPKELLRYCREGCPLNINEFCKMWKSCGKANAGEVVGTKQGGKMIDISNVPTSSRGRRIFPPLSYWTGERVAFRDNEIVYTTGSSPRYSIDRSAERKSNKLQVEEKMSGQSNDLGGSKKGASDALKDENTTLLPTSLQRQVDIWAHRYDVELTNTQKTDRNNAAVSQSDERTKQYGIRQQSPIKKQNLMYTYYKSIPHTDDILSDDQVSQL